MDMLIPDLIIICTCLNNIAEIILWMHPANERQGYNVTSSLIGWAHSQNDPYIVGDDLVTEFTKKTYLDWLRMKCKHLWNTPKRIEAPIIIEWLLWL